MKNLIIVAAIMLATLTAPAVMAGPYEDCVKLTADETSDKDRQSILDAAVTKKFDEHSAMIKQSNKVAVKLQLQSVLENAVYRDCNLELVRKWMDLYAEEGKKIQQLKLVLAEFEETLTETERSLNEFQESLRGRRKQETE